LRNGLIRVETRLKLLVGKRDSSNTYIGKDHYLFEKVTDNDIDTNRYRRNCGLLETLAEEYPQIPFTALFVPSSGVILQDKLPSYGEIYNASALYEIAEEKLSAYTVVNPTELLSAHADEYLYYSNDHHWTTRGAYLGYLALTGGEDSYNTLPVETVSTDFLGTLQSRVPGAETVSDSIQVLTVPDSVQVTQNGTDIGLYDFSCLEEKDQYRVFLGGNYPQVDITGGSGTGSLLIIKDSFANSLVPFLTQDYASITLIDPRYFSGSVRELLSSGAYDEVLVIYELNNFAQDSSLSKLAVE
jgi:hypothetical protein